jgi:dynein heavy chain
LEKKRKTRFGAPFGKKIVCFVDDVNMPQREKYFAQPPIELLRQFLDFRGFYDRQLLFWKDIEDMTIVSACAPPGGGRNEVANKTLESSASTPSPNNIKVQSGCVALGPFITSFVV